MSQLLVQPSTRDAPLDPTEMAEMKEHLVFLRRFKDALRLKLNATEDLLVNGQREPSERGVCRHLLGKVDRAVIDRALEREPLRSDPAARARMLAGAVRVTADVGVLLSYLETLAHLSSHAEAAAAFGEVVRRIDFESLSPTRLARLLQVLIDTFADHERVQVLFGLLGTPTFRRAFDAGAPAFPPAVTEAFLPLRAVHRRLVEETGAEETAALLATGLEQILSAPDPVLRAYAEPLRAGMLGLALGPGVPAALADRAAGVLLPSLPRTSRTYARMAIRRAAQLLQRHADDRARAVLAELRRAQPSADVAERWLGALDARRLGRIAIRGEPPERGRLAAAFWLDGQRPVWLRTATAPAAERLATEARLQAALALPGVASVVEHGVASGIPYVAVAGPGRPLALEVGRPFAVPQALAMAGAAARILRILALAGIVLPDAEPERFLHAGATASSLTLADLDGAVTADPAAAAAAHGALAAALAARLLPPDARARLAPDIGDALARALSASTDLVDLIGVLDRASLLAMHD